MTTIGAVLLGEDEMKFFVVPPDKMAFEERCASPGDYGRGYECVVLLSDGNDEKTVEQMIVEMGNYEWDYFKFPKELQEVTMILWRNLSL